MHSIKSLKNITLRNVYCVAFFVFISLFYLLLTPTVYAENTVNNQQKNRWASIEQSGSSQDVFFHAWGGDPQVNAYIQWAAKQVKQQYNVNLIHVKLSDTSEAVSRVLAEKSAKNHNQGNVDLVWINGANFANMAKHSLLLKGWANQLPNFQLTDPNNNPSVTLDFGVPTLGMESPWGQVSMSFYYDDLATSTPPKNLQQLLNWTEKNPGRFSYPKPPDFLGLSFLKYALVVLHQQDVEHKNDNPNNQNPLYAPATSENTEKVLKPLWTFLDKFHPHLWRKGTHFVQSGVEMRRLVGDTELSLAFTFSGPEIPAAVKRYDLPKSIRSYAMLDGSLSNTHFVGIPYNASHSESAQLVANFLLSPKAQTYKQQAKVWGDKTVLIASSLSRQQQELFITETPHPSALSFNSITRTISEPHPSWVEAITQGWFKRYGVTP